MLGGHWLGGDEAGAGAAPRTEAIDDVDHGIRKDQDIYHAGQSAPVLAPTAAIF